jgi:hypothetical protein
MAFRQDVEQFLKRTGIGPSVFGRCAARDPRLVSDLRLGREVGTRLATRVKDWMAANDMRGASK